MVYISLEALSNLSFVRISSSLQRSKWCVANRDFCTFYAFIEECGRLYPASVQFQSNL